MKTYPLLRSCLAAYKQALLASFLAGVSLLFPCTAIGQTTPELRGNVHFIDGHISTGGSYQIASGRISRRVTDLVVPSPVGRPLVLERVMYNMPVQIQTTAPNTQVGCSAQWNFNIRGYRVFLWAEGENGYGSSVTVNPIKFGAELIYPDGTSSIVKYTNTDGVLFFGTGDRVYLSSPTTVDRLVLQDGSTVRFYQIGGSLYLTASITDPYGLVTTYSKNETKVTDASGRWIKLSFDSATGLVARADASNGDWVNYSWDMESLPGTQYSGATNRLLSVQYSNGTKASYEYKRVYLGSTSTYLGTLPWLCRDVRSSDQLQTVEYTFYPNNTWETVSNGGAGGLYGLKSLGLPGAAPVSTRTPGPTSAIETRGDGSKFTYTFIAQVGTRLRSFKDAMGYVTTFDYGPWHLPYRRFLSGSPYNETLDYVNSTDYSVTDALNRVTKVMYLTVPTQGVDQSSAIETPTRVLFPDEPISNQTNVCKKVIYTDPINPFYISKAIDERGNATIYKRYSNNLIQSISYPDSTSESWTYNSFNQPVTHTLRSGAIEAWDYDGTGRMTAQWLPSNPAKQAGSIQYTYYADDHVWRDRVKTVTDPNGNVTTTEYDLAFENGVQGSTACRGFGWVSKVTNADNTYRQYKYDIYGHKIWERDELGGETSYTYDSYGRLLTTKDPLGRVSEIKYGDTEAESLAMVDSLPKHTLSPMGKKTSFYYDKNRRLIKKIIADGSSSPKTLLYEYDAVGNMTKQREQVGGSTGSEVWRDTTWEYDSRNRKITEHAPLGRDVDLRYDVANNVILVTNTDGTYTSKFYDSMNRVQTATDEMKRTTTYTYYPSGLPEYIIDPKGNQYYHIYDTQGRLVKFCQTNSAGSGWETEETKYDSAGNVTGVKNRTGNWKTITYDIRNRPRTTSWDDTVTPATSTEYDAVGRVKSRSNANSTLTYMYDAAGQLTQEVQAVAGALTKVIDYTYDKDGCRTKMRVHTQAK